MTHPPPGPPSPPRPGGPKHDNLFALAASFGFQDLVTAEKLRRPARAEVGAAAVTGEPSTIPSVVADSEGRAGVRPDSGAAPFTLPPTPPAPRFLTPAELAEVALNP